MHDVVCEFASAVVTRSSKFMGANVLNIALYLLFTSLNISSPLIITELLSKTLLITL